MIKKLGIIIFTIFLIYIGNNGIKGQTPFIEEERGNSNDLYNVVNVNYCELLDNPKVYDKQIVRITTLYRNGFELSEFYDLNCSSKGSIWVEFDDGLKQFTRKSVLKLFHKNLNPKRTRKKGVIEIEGLAQKIAITVVGQFNAPLPGILIGPPDNQKRILTGYGHMGAFNYLFTIKSIETVKILD